VRLTMGAARTANTSWKQSMTTRDAANQTPILMYIGSWCGDCRLAKRVFTSFHMPFLEVNVEEDERAAAFVLRLNRGLLSVPPRSKRSSAQ